ncbi:MAG: NAD-dependent succinate-semialdehyde dehydrogenase [Conexibacter sp.]|nr:NAD-dependent succinate-semialdehyde dehydrogenase [Conexibacter sp.]
MTQTPQATSVPAQYTALGLYLDGEWIGSRDRDCVDVTNPATSAVIGQLPLATPDDVDRALASAQQGFEAWRTVSAWDRGAVLKRTAELLRERADAIARVITLEEGKTLPEARGEILRTADTFEWSGEEARHRCGRLLPSGAPGVRQLVVEEPVGPVAAFGPWNFPVLSPARKLAELLAAGCSCVIKPAEETPGSFLEVVRACLDAGVTERAVNVVFGDPPVVAEHLIASPIIRKVSFTGSIPVGREIAALAGRHLKPVSLELGGHAPVIVFDDVDVVPVAIAAARAKFRNAGQICVVPSRFFVHRKVHDRFVEAFTKTAFALRVGDGLDEATEMGPLANARRVVAMAALVEDAATAVGATVQTSDRDVPQGGSFWRPTVVLTQSDDVCVMREEPFGPIAPITPFSDLREVLTRANALGYGLAGYAFARSFETRRAVADRLAVGMLAINSFEISTPESPFGGVKDSGHGTEGGIEGLAAYLVPKYVNER